MIPTFHLSHVLFAAVSFALIIPVNTTDIRAKLKGAFSKTPVTGAPDKDAAISRKAASKVYQEQQKRKALTDELNDVKTSDARKQEIIVGLQGQLEAAESERDEHKAKVEELTPKAKAWNNYEHKERTKLIDGFPPERRNAVKKLAESLSIEDFREYATSLNGKGAVSTTDAGKGKDGAKNWETILAGDPDAAGKAIEADAAGYNTYMDNLGK